MVTLKNATELTIANLLSESHDWALLIFNIEEFACFRGYLPGMEEHHIEPERERTIYLWPLEHLAIHIAHAKLEDTNSNRAKVAAFVKPFPGSFRRVLPVSENLKNAILHFGQGRPESGENLNSHPNTVAARKKPKPHSAGNARKGAEKTRGKPRSVPITWGDKISEAIASKGEYTCPYCGKVMKNWPSNILQHERSSKCLKQSSPQPL